jgi:putative nucleotidyltransferase with HDIG domain
VNVLIVDDNKTNVTLLSFLVKRVDDATPIEFTDPLPALAWCEGNDPDLVLVDYMMPEMNGLQFIQRFRSMRGKTSIPIIMVTAVTENDVRHGALELSANDFLTKPVDKIELIARVRNMLALRKSQLQLSNRADWLAAEVKKATLEIQARERELIYRLSRAAEFRDPETGAHLLRMANYARHIAKNLGLSESEQGLILDAAPLHDIGKMGTPDHILLKPDKLNEEEKNIMRRHAEIGAEILKGSTSALLQTAAIIAITHHEKYDGSGYPYGLKGEGIPLHGRIIAIADVFDALTSERPYKPDWGLERAIAYVRNNTGSHFDPVCVDAFFKEWENVLAIRAQYQDDPPT